MDYSGPITVLVFGILLANAKKIPLEIVKRFGSNELSEFSLSGKMILILNGMCCHMNLFKFSKTLLIKYDGYNYFG